MKAVFWLGLLLVLGICCNCQSSTIIVNVIEQPRSENITLLCTVSSADDLTIWTYLNISESARTSLMSFQNGICEVSPPGSFLTDDKRYSYTCNSTMYQVTVLYNKDYASIHNHMFACRDAVQSDGTGSTWIIKVTDGSTCSFCEPTITFDVMEITEGDNVQFTCRVSSNVTWINWSKNIGSNTVGMGVQNGQCNTSSSSFLDNTSEYNYTCNKTVYQVTRLNVQRSEHNDMYMCTLQSQTEGKGSNWIIKVKAPVISVTMTPTNYMVNNVENTAVKFTCKTSTARPAASVYWYRHPNGKVHNKTQITENVTTTADYNDLKVIKSTIRIVPTRQDNNTKIFCAANNTVNTTLVEPDSKRLLNILYKAEDPYITQGDKYRVIENSIVTLSCSAKGGNPTPTLSWSFTNFTSTNQSTIISNGNVTTTVTWNVSRTHNGTCKCTSQQTMFYDENIDVALIVLYAASVTSFTIDGFTSHSVTVNESVPVSFMCHVDSKPTAVTTLRHKNNVLKSKTSNIVDHKIAKARCLDAGTYYCSARNEYNGENDSVYTVRLFVNCYPRTVEEVDMNIPSEKNTSITITLNVIAYPPPTFTWYQLVNDSWTLLENDDNYTIQSSNVQSSLTIHSVGMDDFTSYKVIAENDLGDVEEVYVLSPNDKPDSPTQFTHIGDHTTISSIHLQWKPGFDGGLAQTFYIKYKRSSDIVWNYLNVSDNGEETMDLSFTGLTENTQYKFVILASNEKGNSSESSVLIASTKAIYKGNLGPLIGGIAGGVTGYILLVIVIIVLIRRYPVFKGTGANKAEIRRSVSDDSDEGDDLVDNPMYESADKMASAASTSSELSFQQKQPNRPSVTDNGDVYAVVKKNQDSKGHSKSGSGMDRLRDGDEYESVEVNNVPSTEGVGIELSLVKATATETELYSVNKDGLMYADIVFNDKQPGEKIVIISDDPTQYDIVDFSKKAEHLPDSIYENAK